VILLPFLWLERQRFPLRLWAILALIGAINSAAPFALFAWAAQLAPAGIGAICNAMVVLFTALVAALFFGEPVGRKRAIALLVGFAGVVVLASSRIEGASVGMAVAAGTLAALLYAFGANLVRKYLTGMPPAAVAAATLSCAALLTLPFALATWPDSAPSLRAWSAAGLLGVVCTGLAFAVFYRLI
jgi:drug/metabolite transporter (DMT)-like permease